MNTFAERMRFARKHAGLTQQALATAMRVSQSAVNQMEHGHISSLKGQQLIALERATGVRGEWVATGKGERFTPAGTLPKDERDQVHRIMESLSRLDPEMRARVEDEIRFLDSLKKG